MSAISTWSRRLEAGAAALLFAAGLGACQAGGEDTVVTPGDPGTIAENGGDELGQTALAIRFESFGERETSCGVAEGIHVAISDGAGAMQECNASWAPATVNGGEFGDGSHVVADCLFVLKPGSWNVRAVEATDAAGNALACCSATFPATVTVAESQTTEFGASINCQTVQSGGLDIYAFMNRPPYIQNITITPSKFGRTCDVIELAAASSDPDGDTVNYRWSIVSSPGGSDVALLGKGPLAFFSADTMGDYNLDLRVSDHALSHHLTFPIHITSRGECDGGDAEDRVNSAANGSP